MGDDGFCGFSVPWRGTTASPQSQKVATPAAAASARPQGPLSPQKKMSGAPGCAIAAVYAFRTAAGVGSAKTAGDCLVAAGEQPHPHHTAHLRPPALPPRRRPPIPIPIPIQTPQWLSDCGWRASAGGTRPSTTSLSRTHGLLSPSVRLCVCPHSQLTMTQNSARLPAPRSHRSVLFCSALLSHTHVLTHSHQEHTTRSRNRPPTASAGRRRTSSWTPRGLSTGWALARSHRILCGGSSRWYVCLCLCVCGGADVSCSSDCWIRSGPLRAYWCRVRRRRARRRMCRRRRCRCSGYVYSLAACTICSCTRGRGGGVLAGGNGNINGKQLDHTMSLVPTEHNISKRKERDSSSLCIYRAEEGGLPYTDGVVESWNLTRWATASAANNIRTDTRQNTKQRAEHGNRSYYDRSYPRVTTVRAVWTAEALLNVYITFVLTATMYISRVLTTNTPPS